MAAETMGRLRVMVRVSAETRLTSPGRTVEWAGTRDTSSNVSARWMSRMMGLHKDAHYTFRLKPG